MPENQVPIVKSINLDVLTEVGSRYTVTFTTPDGDQSFPVDVYLKDNVTVSHDNRREYFFTSGAAKSVGSTMDGRAFLEFDNGRYCLWSCLMVEGEWVKIG